MKTLFWKQKNKVINLVSKPFSSEEEFQNIVYDTQELFEDLIIFKKQVHSGDGKDIPDIVAMDNNGSICIIEMKNVVVDEKILQQILRYAIWAKNSPDSIKSLWYEFEDRPEMEVDWDNNQVRFMVIAPEINPSILRFLSTINFEVELIEINRWVHKRDSFLLVNSVEQKQDKKIKTAKGTEIYDKDYYKKHKNNQSVDYFYAFIKEIEALLKSKGWDFEKKFNKHYCGFKYGLSNVFTIEWIGTKSFGLCVRMKEADLKKISPKGVDMSYRYHSGTFKVVPGKTKASRFTKVIAAMVKLKTAQ